MANERALLTYDDYREIPGDGRRYELHAGELVISPAPGTRHRRIKSRLFRLLRLHVEAVDLGEVFFSPFDCVLSTYFVYQPDLVFVEKERVPTVDDSGLKGPPILAVEIESEASRDMDEREKPAAYACFGVQHYWLLKPDTGEILAHTLRGSAYPEPTRATAPLIASFPPFPECGLDVAAIFR
jgi:Uma2 family endonuclease